MAALFRYFFVAMEAEEDPKTASTFVFLRGGLGFSSIGGAMAQGPCFISTTTDKPELNPYSWTQKANSIWVDAPGPTGFSEGPIEPDLNAVVNNLIEFVTQFFKDHPNFNTKVYIVGLSAAGSIAAMLGTAIIRQDLGIHLEGVMLGSSVIDPGATIHDMREDLVQCEELISKCNNGVVSPVDPCEKAVKECNTNLITPVSAFGKSTYDLRVSPGDEDEYFELLIGDVAKFLNKPEVKAKLGVTKKYEDLNIKVMRAFSKYGAYDRTEFINPLLDDGLKVLVVNGDQDYVTNAIGALNWMVTLKGMFNYGDILQQTPFKPLEYESGVLGKIKSSQYPNGAKLAFIEVNEAGHFFQLNQPKGIQAAFEAFLSGEI
ncbi:Vitellogenic carboxypeptidase, putative [Perkinsus marinus ATCC 50983]|uniref:Vitellogenic carboxypeptidase, putative n=1 Tax=Perkinsus marinus (strain ATCC 50983 / TXsc) TaxID=423536 RepID=C5LSD8_PERM5|nr:Vitellogenic carboxypeptidase, putative [Perkinsus marinus ATCC 50983]EER00355.1 Vitellogenic carboxypeptidase, putative [Perkinsus marinus ATCC 50983]|eukprot:XP_002767637.1 Vitellogenic carboxypeptidase, putative [Perkinsus marinus ATCC 50983]